MTEGSPQWADPGPKRTGKYDWVQILAQLKGNPNEWMRIFERDNVSYPNAIRAGSISTLRDARIEMQTRNNEQGEDGRRTCALYLRWTGKKEK